jgi:hypothetical protein
MKRKAQSEKRKISAGGGREKSSKLLVLSFGFALCVLSFTLFCYAADIRLEATVDRNKIALGEALRLNLAVYGIQNVPAPLLDKIEGFDARYIGPSTMVSIINGVITSSITHAYTLVPLKTGAFTIGPFSIEAQGGTFTSNTITIEVVSAPSGGQPSTGQQASRESSSSKINEEELKDRIFLILSAPKRAAYLNENIPLTIKLYVDRIGVRDIEFPELEADDFSVEKFGQPRQYRERLGGVLYDVIEFTSGMFGIKPGEFTLGPAKLRCNLLIRRQNQRSISPSNDDPPRGFFGDFFGGYEAHPLELRSAGLPVTVLPLPQEGKPDGFDGALGNFRLDVEAAPLQVKAGDPITLKMTVKGEGDLDTVKPPKLQSKDGFKVYDPQVKQNDTEKIFEQVLMPDSEKVVCIPQINFSFFNTKTGQYQILTRPPIPITVTKAEDGQAKLVESPQSQVSSAQKEELGRDIIYLKNSPGRLRKTGNYLYQDFSFWLIQILSLVSFIGIIIIRLEQRKLTTDRRYARRLRAPGKAKKGVQEAERLLREGKTEAFFDAVYKTVREYLADRFHLPSGGITAITIEDLAEEKGISGGVMDKIKRIFSDCDMARYAPSQFGQKQLEGIFKSLKEVIDYLEKHNI